MAVSRKTVLNLGPVRLEAPDASLSQELYNATSRLLETATFDLEESRLDYSGLKDSQAYEDYITLSAGLRGFDPARLESRSERLAFWINLYNCLIIHGIIALGVRESVKEVSGFFVRIAYNVGEWLFSADDIEHGILRGNSRHPYRAWRPFLPWDGRRVFAVEPLDPRVHFALVCGASSCPAVGAYNPSKIDDQLTFAAQAFVNDPARMRIEPGSATVRLSQIFRWYEKDFGGSKEAVLGYLLGYLDPSAGKEWLEANLGKAAVRYLPYEWSLNA